MPTLNLSLENPKDIPNEGVYAVSLLIGGSRFNGVMHVGPRPTFKEPKPSIEAHVLNFRDEIHAETLEFQILGRLRDVQKFDSPGSLKKQIAQDIMDAGRYW